jgi:hypothetical protein
MKHAVRTPPSPHSFFFFPTLLTLAKDQSIMILVRDAVAQLTTTYLVRFKIT